MKVHEVFPTVVAQDRIDVHDEFKDEYFNELKSLWFDVIIIKHQKILEDVLFI